MVYSDSNKPYTLFPDASKYAWLGVLPQTHHMVVDSKSISHQHPITYERSFSKMTTKLGHFD